MSKAITIEAGGLPEALAGTAVLFTDSKLELGEASAGLLGRAGVAAFRKAAGIEAFKGKKGAALALATPGGTKLDRLVVIGVGDAADRAKLDFVNLGGSVRGALAKADAATVVLDMPGGAAITPEQGADIALGATLRNYDFDRYKTKKKDDDNDPQALKLTLAAADPQPIAQAMRRTDAIGAGVCLARDLVNEPANVLFPAEFANRAKALKKLGVAVEVLGERDLEKLGMRTLLGVGQGSERESHVVTMRWNGARGSRAKPVAFVGKGVCFDTGGISIKPAASMEDMKGDMAGAACVVGLMHALAARKAKVNAVGIIGLVENMPDGKAQRPGDIVTSLSGQTIEIINTDAEGRLVLADLLWHIKETVKPQFMVNLATLTGAIIVALGHEHAGMFSNDDTLSERLSAAGTATGEKVWRMPLGPEYDKQIDSKFADMKNTGGRSAGSITAAQFLKRFVGDTPWAHLDVAGTAMGSPQTDISKGWASGWGVRLLDRLVADHYEG